MTVPRSRRVLVHLVRLVPPGPRHEVPVYLGVEQAAMRLVTHYLRPQYGHRVLRRGAQASSDALVDALDEATARPGVEAVDVLLAPHGTSRHLLLADATDRSRRQDRLAARYYTASGRPNLAPSVDSRRVVAGDPSVRIGTPPVLR